ncbi:Ada DNA repair, metal-binding [Ceraceosorus bombacis]|uniref:Ada DNA repair, metal-binding n=1 Tax=Ceraceosorus bombacis TaxID=401625 RepID=A0A0P1B8X4_9BASI|nr:Ada DNA repair, metal-binding [Ceraceosorus bombacis]
MSVPSSTLLAQAQAHHPTPDLARRNHCDDDDKFTAASIPRSSMSSYPLPWSNFASVGGGNNNNNTNAGVEGLAISMTGGQPLPDSRQVLAQLAGNVGEARLAGNTPPQASSSSSSSSSSSLAQPWFNGGAAIERTPHAGFAGPYWNSYVVPLTEHPHHPAGGGGGGGAFRPAASSSPSPGQTTVASGLVGGHPRQYGGASEPRQYGGANYKNNNAILRPSSPLLAPPHAPSHAPSHSLHDSPTRPQDLFTDSLHRANRNNYITGVYNYRHGSGGEASIAQQQQQYSGGPLRARRSTEKSAHDAALAPYQRRVQHAPPAAAHAHEYAARLTPKEKRKLDERARVLAADACNYDGFKPMREFFSYASDDEMWEKVAKKSHYADHVFVYYNKRTRHYCRPSCSADKKVAREDIEYHFKPDGVARLAANKEIKACKRCHADQDGVVNTTAIRIGEIARKLVCSSRDEEELLDASSASASAPPPPPPPRASLKDSADSCNISHFHFHRQLKIVCGITHGELVKGVQAMQLQDELGRDSTEDGSQVAPMVIDRILRGWSLRRARRALGGLTPQQFAAAGHQYDVILAVTETPYGIISALIAESPLETRGMEAEQFSGGAILGLAIGLNSEQRMRTRFPSAKRAHDGAWEREIREMVQSHIDGCDREDDLPRDVAPYTAQDRQAYSSRFGLDVFPSSTLFSPSISSPWLGHLHHNTGLASIHDESLPSSGPPGPPLPPISSAFNASSLSSTFRF